MTTLCKVALPDILIFFYLFIYLFIDEEEGNGLAVGYAALFFFLFFFLRDGWWIEQTLLEYFYFKYLSLLKKNDMTCWYQNVSRLFYL